MTKRQATLHPRSIAPTGRRLRTVIMLGMVLLAVFLLVKMYVTRKPELPLPPAAPTADTEQNTAKPVDVQFDFYTVLPKMAVTTEKIKAPVILPPPAETTHQTQPTLAGGYVLQVAALSQLSDANRYRDQIQALGYRVFVQEYRNNNQLLYRILVGPYASLDLAQRDQAQLKQKNLNSNLLKMQPHLN